MPQPPCAESPEIPAESAATERAVARELLRGALLSAAREPSLLAGCDPIERTSRLEELLGAGISRRLGLFALPADFRLSVVIPCYNEAATIDETLRRVLGCGIPVEAIVVDDGSRDAARDKLADWQRRPQQADARLKILFHGANQGKGAALKTGFLAASGDVALVQDADLEYDPLDYWRLIRPIVDGEADVVFGSRFLRAEHCDPLAGQTRPASPRGEIPYFWHTIGNRLITGASNLFTGLALTDIETGYKVFRREVIAQIAPTLVEKRFGVEPELTAKVARLAGVRIRELPIGYSGRTYAQGKKIGWLDGARALYCVARYWWAP